MGVAGTVLGSGGAGHGGGQAQSGIAGGRGHQPVCGRGRHGDLVGTDADGRCGLKVDSQVGETGGSGRGAEGAGSSLECGRRSMRCH
jgi:hypothetical protein